MRRYTVTYAREMTQPVDALTITDAAAYAKKFAAQSNWRVLSIVAVEPAAPPELPAPAAA